MIRLTKLNGKAYAVNAWLIEQVEETPDTMITLNNGKKMIVKETMDEVILLSREFFFNMHHGKYVGG